MIPSTIAAERQALLECERRHPLSESRPVFRDEREILDILIRGAERATDTHARLVSSPGATSGDVDAAASIATRAWQRTSDHATHCAAVRRLWRV